MGSFSLTSQRLNRITKWLNSPLGTVRKNIIFDQFLECLYHPYLSLTFVGLILPALLNYSKPFASLIDRDIYRIKINTDGRLYGEHLLMDIMKS